MTNPLTKASTFRMREKFTSLWLARRARQRSGKRGSCQTLSASFL